MARQTRLILCPVNLRHVKIEHLAYTEAVEMAQRGGAELMVVTLATERKVGLIVMDAANPKVQDYVLGTNASHVVTHAECSVYVLRG